MLRLIFFTMLASIAATNLSAQQSDEFYATQIGFSGGPIFPKLRDLNYLSTATPERGLCFAGNLNYYFLRLGRNTRLYTGARLFYFTFRTVETNDTPYISFKKSGNIYHWRRGIGTFAMGAPMGIHHWVSLTKQSALIAGVGVYPCFQMPDRGDKTFPVRIYGDVQAGMVFRNKLFVLAEITKSFIKYPLNLRYNAGYSFLGFSLGIRYAIARLKPAVISAASP